MEQAPAWLERGPQSAPPSPEESLALAQESLDQLRHDRERCRHLARAARRVGQRNAALNEQVQALRAQAGELRPVIDTLSVRLQTMGSQPEPLPSHLGMPPELARLQADIDQTRGRAAALSVEWERVCARRIRRQKHLALVRAAWEQAAQGAVRDERNLSRARDRALAEALALGRAAVAAGRAAAEMEKLLGPLRPRELAEAIGACRKRAAAWTALAAGARRQLAGLDQAQSLLPGLGAPPAAEPAQSPSASLPEPALLEDLSRRVREIHQEQVTQALAEGAPDPPAPGARGVPAPGKKPPKAAGTCAASWPSARSSPGAPWPR